MNQEYFLDRNLEMYSYHSCNVCLHFSVATILIHSGLPDVVNIFTIVESFDEFYFRICIGWKYDFLKFENNFIHKLYILKNVEFLNRAITNPGRRSSLKLKNDRLVHVMNRDLLYNLANNMSFIRSLLAHTIYSW